MSAHQKTVWKVFCHHCCRAGASASYSTLLTGEDQNQPQQSTEKCWRISQHVTDDATVHVFAKLYVT